MPFRARMQAAYAPSPKHEPGHNWGSENPIKTQEEGQELLDTGYSNGKQLYNVTEDGTIVKFQPDGTPDNGYHSYAIDSPSEIPTSILRQMLADGKIGQHLPYLDDYHHFTTRNARFCGRLYQDISQK